MCIRDRFGDAGEAFVADIEKIGTFGDLLGGPTKVDREPEDTIVEKLFVNY